MPSRSPARRALAAAVGGVARQCGPDDPRLPDLRRDLAAERLADYVRETVSEAPPLTPAQRDRIAALLAPSMDGGTAA